MKFHTVSEEELYSALSTSSNGLTKEEAQSRLEKNGKNVLDSGKKQSMIVKFLSQFKDVMILVLIAAAIVSAAVAIYQNEYSELIDSGLIFLIVIVNAIIGFVQENKADAAIEALKSMNKPYCKVIRNGSIEKIKSEDVVVGDIVVLEAGDIVPADVRLTFSASLKIEEAALTGESLPSEKDAFATLPEEVALGDKKNMAYSSGVVSYGRGTGVVVATGMDTEVGKIAKMLSSSTDQTTPLQKELAKTAKVLSIIVLAVAAVIFAASLIKDVPLIDAFMTAVAIAVAAIPEGLPAVVTIVLAVGIQVMSKRNAIIRNLPAVETLGCCEIICSDKTGTLTLNQMTVKRSFTLSGGALSDEESAYEGDNEVLIRAMALCNDSIQGEEGLNGDPTETALVYFAQNKGVDYAKLKSDWVRVDEIPFDSVRKVMTAVNEFNGERVAHIKGATDIMIGKCKYVLENGAVRAITAEDVEKIQSANDGMAKKALRVLGVAIKKENLEDKERLEEDLIFVGLVGMIDPPRAEVKKAVATCKRAGMKPVMITGDHLVTASAIAAEIGILSEGDKVMLGADIDKLSDEEFASVIREYAVFARVSPENKVRIVKAYRAMGKIVAMTGDGVNDAPSIKEADIGIGMGITGTDVSKGAADMILTDDNFATIINSVEEGRKIYSNIKKAVQFLLSANIAEVLALFIATMFLLSPGQEFLTPVMILWINLVTDSFPALSLGMERAEHDVMNYPPRKANSSLFAGKTGLDILIQGVFQTILVISIYLMGNNFFGDHEQAMTMAFIGLCFIQLFHSYNMRSQNNSVLNREIFSNKWLNMSFAAGVALILLVALVPPVASVFGVVSLSIVEWAVCVGIALAIVPLVELQKLIERKVMKIK